MTSKIIFWVGGIGPKATLVLSTLFSTSTKADQLRSNKRSKIFCCRPSTKKNCGCHHQNVIQQNNVPIYEIETTAKVVRRRPADIYLPCLDGTPTALDFAVTGLQRPESLPQAAQVPVSAAAAYAQVKCNHQHTAQLCADQGVRFLPLVSESTGAWDTAASRTLRVIASAVAAREGQVGSSVYTVMLQECSVLLRSFRARAALRRRSELVTFSQHPVRASAVLLESVPDVT